MHLRWTEQAAEDLERIADNLSTHARWGAATDIVGLRGTRHPPEILEPWLSRNAAGFKANAHPEDGKRRTHSDPVG